MAVLLLATAAAPVWHLHFVNREMPSTHSDLVDEWAGARDALHGKDPYSSQGMRDTQIAYYGRALTPADNVDPQGFPYPAHFVVLFAPLARFSWNTVRLIFILSVTPLLIVSFWLCLRSLNLPVIPRKAALIVFLALCSWPVVWGMRLQQPTLPIVAFVFIACYLLSREHGAAAGILLACATVKPQLVLPLLVWLLLWAALRGLWSFVASFFLTTTALLIWAERIMPGWFPRWLAEVHGYGRLHGELPLQFLLGHSAGLAATMLILLWSAYLLWLLRRSRAGSRQFGIAIALALAVAVCAGLTKLPTVYNQIALLPACLILIGMSPEGALASVARRIALVFLLFGYATLYIAVAGETIFGVSSVWHALPFADYLLPLPIMIAVALVAREATDPELAVEPAITATRRSGHTLPAAAHTYDETFYRYIQKGAVQSAEAIVPLIAGRLAIDSVLDVGSGAGAWLSVYRKLGVPTALGVDGDYVERSALLIPAASFIPRDVSKSFDLGQRFSIVQCLEVGEHIPTEASRTLIANLTRHSDRVLFSAAVPGQGGENHINEQPYQFWRGLFAEHGYAPYDCLRPLLHKAAGVEPWYRHNVLLYVADEARAALPPAVASTRIPENQPIPNVSSGLYRMRTRVLVLLPVKTLSQIAVMKHRFILFFRPVS